MPNIKLEGKEPELYVSTSEPTSPTESTEYDRAGLIVDLTPIELENEEISAVDRDDGAHDSPVYGTQNSSWQLTANALQEDTSGTVGPDVGQTMIRDAALNQNRIYWLIEPPPDLDGWHGQSIITNYNETANTGDVAQYDASFANVGAPTSYTNTP
jgi:hypothetical protein